MLEDKSVPLLCLSPLLTDRFQAVRKEFRKGAHRLVAPAMTVEHLRPLLPAMGITRLANVTGLDSIGIPVAVACRPNSRSVAVSNGKGLDLAAAEASALMEAVEGFHAERISLPLKLCSYDDLTCTHRLADVKLVPRRTNSIYHPNLPLLWVEGHDLVQQEPIWLPYELVHTNYTVPLPQGSGCFVMSSNGLASGNHLLEAISHGICEVVERDATTLWELSRGDYQRRTRLDLSSVDDTACHDALEKYERAGVDVAVYETTSDIGLPAFLCLISGTNMDPLYNACGMGCHPDRGVALLRALTEAAQSRLAVIAGSRDDIFVDDYEQLQRTNASRAFRSNLDHCAMRDFHKVPTWETDTFAEDVVLELNQLRAVGIERVVVVDLTRTDLDIPVVRIVIPGLEYSFSAENYALGLRAQARLGATS
jgi:YcaO-like protein with predicted kinase domain